MSDTEKLLSDEPYEEDITDDTADDDSVDEGIDEGDEGEQDDSGGQPDEDSGPEDVKSSEDKSPKSVPLNALLEERRARQALQRQVEELTRRLPVPQPVDPTADFPDPINDPQGFAKAIVKFSEDTARRSKLELSEALVKEEGATDDDIEAALTALQSIPESSRPSFREKAHPFKELLKWHKDHKLINGNPDAVDLDSLRRQIKEEIMRELKVASETPEKKSLRSPPSAAGDIGGRRINRNEEPVELDTKALFGEIK